MPNKRAASKRSPPVKYYRIRNPQGKYLYKIPYADKNPDECFDYEGKLFDQKQANSVMFTLTAYHPEYPRVDFIQYDVAEVGPVHSSSAVPPTDEYKQFIKLRRNYSFDSFLKIAARAERKGLSPTYVGRVLGKHHLKRDFGVPIMGTLSVREHDNSGGYDYVTYMAIKDDNDLMKVRLYCPTFTCLFNYKTGSLLEGKPPR
jgi:hypothetical protein